MTPDPPIRRVLVADTHVPFVSGGAERHVASLVEELRRRGYEAETATVPFRPQSRETLLGQAAAWRLLELDAADGRPVDLLIATRFPSYFARHPRKVAWVIHQHRPAYELCGTPFSDSDWREEDLAIRQRLLELDRQMLGECRRVFANARNTAHRLERFNGVAATPLYHPPPLATRLHEGRPGDYVLVVGRLERVKRPDLAVRAMAHVAAPTRLVLAGAGSEQAALMELARATGVGDRIAFAGAPDDARLVELYAGAMAVLYAPFDEDYGYVTLEAFLSGKPVITASDSGGTLEFVTDGETGLVTAPEPEAVGAAISRLAGNAALAARLGAAGRARAALVTWDGVVEQLVG